MPSLRPTRFNNYLVDSSVTLSADTWNNCIGDLAIRMGAVEEKATGYDGIINAGIGAALNQINNSLAPAIAQINTMIQEAQTALNSILSSSAIGVDGGTF